MSGRALKVPVIMQMNLEYGAACSHGDSVLWQVADPRTGPAGLRGFRTVPRLKTCSSQPGPMALRPRAIDTTGPSADRSIPALYPPLGIRSFVVLCGWDRNGAVLNDPAKGAQDGVYPIDELDKQFTGICLQFKPMETFEKEGGPTSIWRFAKRRMAGTSDIVVFLMLIGIMLTFIGIVNPVFSQVFLDQILSGNNLTG